MDTIPHDFSFYLLQEGLKKVMDVVWVLSGVVLENEGLREEMAGLIV
ncbi:MAG: hypothetical protein WBZ36_02660 [Candidatus Nitrosopolaris sp.]